MTKHMTVQPNAANRAPASAHSSQTTAGPGKVQPIPAPPRPAALNDLPTKGGAGDLGKA